MDKEREKIYQAAGEFLDKHFEMKPVREIMADFHLEQSKELRRQLDEALNLKLAIIKALEYLNDDDCDPAMVYGVLMRALPLEEQPDFGD